MISRICKLIKTQIVSDKLSKEGLYSESLVENTQTLILRCVTEFLLKQAEWPKAGPHFEKCLVRVQAAYDVSYDRIYTGEYHCVPEVHRMTFAVSSILKCVLHLIRAGSDKETIKQSIFILDMAKMMGTQLKHKSGEETVDLIVVMIELLTLQLKINVDVEQPPAKKLKLDCPTRRICEIDVVDAPALDIFLNSYYVPRKPALLTNTINDWPALTRWSDMNYLINVAGQRTVPIELGQHYTHENWSQKLVKFEEFVENYILADNCQTIGYLAQHELFDQIPELQNDILVPEYCVRGAPPRLKAWLGPKGTVSPLHTDPTHNLLAQVFGAKLVILAEPAATPNLYAHDHFVLNNTSQVDANAPDFDKHPLVKSVRFKRIILKAGDVLYIPPGWWHYVRSLSPSFSVSFWFD